MTTTQPTLPFVAVSLNRDARAIIAEFIRCGWHLTNPQVLAKGGSGMSGRLNEIRAALRDKGAIVNTLRYLDDGSKESVYDVPPQFRERMRELIAL